QIDANRRHGNAPAADCLADRLLDLGLDVRISEGVRVLLDRAANRGLKHLPGRILEVHYACRGSNWIYDLSLSRCVSRDRVAVAPNHVLLRYVDAKRTHVHDDYPFPSSEGSDRARAIEHLWFRAATHDDSALVRCEITLKHAHRPSTLHTSEAA